MVQVEIINELEKKSTTDKKISLTLKKNADGQIVLQSPDGWNLLQIDPTTGLLKIWINPIGRDGLHYKSDESASSNPFSAAYSLLTS